MLFQSNVKLSLFLNPTSATNGATITSGQIDTMGYDTLKIVLGASTSDAATNNPATLRLTESDDTVLTNFAAITAAVGDGAGGFTIPNSTTATTRIAFAVFNIDCRPRKRYITLEVSPVTTQTFFGTAILGRAEQSPVGTTNENAAVVVNA